MDNVDYGWLMKMLKHDIADKKFLKAGIMENGKYRLELAEEKTKILVFGRFARQNRERMDNEL